jgi:succinyl-CoA synthetase beta subunit
MKIHEYQAKTILRSTACPCRGAMVAATPAEARAVAERWAAASS